MPREWAEAEYSRIYWTVVDDPKFENVFDDDRRWAAYTRLLMAAEATYPSPAPLPRWLADDVLAYLAEVRIIVVIRGSSYRIVGLKTEREGRLNGNAIGGKKRAEQAERNEQGRFVAAPSLAPADGPAGSPANPAVPSVSSSDKPARSTSDKPAVQPRRDEDRRDSDETRILLPERTSRATTDRPDIQALRDRGWKRVSAKQRAVLDEVLARHDVTGPAFAAEVIRVTPRDRDPLAAVMDADRRWQVSERSRMVAEEAAWAKTKQREKDELAAGPSWLNGIPDPAAEL